MRIQALYHPTYNSGYFSLDCKTRTLERVTPKAPLTADTHDAPRAALAHHVTLRQLEA